MHGVDLGVRRVPVNAGTGGLLKQAMDVKSFKMVEFEYYKTPLSNIRDTLLSPDGTFCWVIGARGTGKTEVLSHIFRESIRVTIENNRDTHRLPIYISVSNRKERENYGEKEGALSIGLIDFLSKKSIAEAFRIIREGGGRNTHYSSLRDMLPNKRDMRQIDEYLGKDDFSLSTFIRQYNTLGTGLRFALIIDDVDKISTAATTRFFEEAQTDLQELVGAGTVIITSVTKKFRSENQQNHDLNYCLHEKEHIGTVTELRVPDLSDLTSAEAQKFINHRIKHLHYDETTNDWKFKDEEEPMEKIEDVIQNPKWKSFDPTKMRRNGALLTLNAWLANDNQVALRQVIRNMDAILRNCDQENAELTSYHVEKILKQSDTADLEIILDGLKNEILKNSVTQERLLKEINALEHISEKPEIWHFIKDAVFDRVANGTWAGGMTGRASSSSGEEKGGKYFCGFDEELTREEGSLLHNNMGTLLKKITESFHKSSGIFNALEYIANIQIISDDEIKKLRDAGQISITIDELFTKITPRELTKTLEQCHGNSPKQHPEKSKAKNNEKVKKVLEPDEILSNAWMATTHEYGDVDELETSGQENFGSVLSFNVTKELMELFGVWGSNKSRITEEFEKDSHNFRLALVDWFAHRVDHRNEKELEALTVFSKAMKGVNPRDILTHASVIQKIFLEKYVSRRYRQLEQFVTSREEKLPKGWKIRIRDKPDKNELKDVIIRTRTLDKGPIYLELWSTEENTSTSHQKIYQSCNDFHEIYHWLYDINKKLQLSQSLPPVCDNEAFDQYVKMNYSDRYFDVVKIISKLSKVDILIALCSLDGCWLTTKRPGGGNVTYKFENYFKAIKELKFIPASDTTKFIDIPKGSLPLCEHCLTPYEKEGKVGCQCKSVLKLIEQVGNETSQAKEQMDGRNKPIVGKLDKTMRELEELCEYQSDEELSEIDVSLIKVKLLEMDEIMAEELS